MNEETTCKSKDTIERERLSDGAGIESEEVEVVLRRRAWACAIVAERG